MNDTPLLRTAVAQIDVVPGDLHANIEKHLEMIGQARKKGAGLLLFPELSLTGYTVGHRGYELALGVDHPLMKKLADAAGEMYVGVGYIEEGYAAQYFNAAAVLHRGHVLFNHRKVNLATYGKLEEGKFFASGRYVETFELPRPFTGAMLICADAWNPALVHLGTLHGATALLIPTNSAHDAVSGEFSTPNGWDAVLRFYAMIYGLPLVFANRIGKEEGLCFWGGSRILGPTGQPLAEAPFDEEALIVADLQYDAVRKARFELPTVRDSNLALVTREIERLAERVGIPERYRAR